MKNNPPLFGEYLKLLKSGEIGRWKSYDEINQVVEVENSDGTILSVPRNEVGRLTSEEEIDFLRAQKNPTQ